jgi:small subunit ribosomal protein S16
MVVIRLSRGGTNKRPFYHVVATDKRNARDCGKHLERLGYFNPIAAGGETKLLLDMERVNDWIAKGAQPSLRMSHLIKEFQEQVAANPIVAATPITEATPIETASGDTAAQ